MAGQIGGIHPTYVDTMIHSRTDLLFGQFAQANLDDHPEYIEADLLGGEAQSSAAGHQRFVVDSDHSRQRLFRVRNVQSVAVDDLDERAQRAGFRIVDQHISRDLRVLPQ